MSTAILQEESVGITVISMVREIEEVKRLVIVADIKAEERWEAYHRALALQSVEIERRLEHLNGEAERIAAERAQITTQVRREMEHGFLASHQEVASVRETLGSFMAEQRGVNKGIALIWTIFVAIVTIILASAGLWFASRS